MIHKYCESYTEYSRRKTQEVKIGDLPMGGTNPIRIQSMTTVDTMDTAQSVAQTLRMVESGCEYVRITAPSLKEARNLEKIKNELRKRNCNVPLIADIHFTPNAAELAATIVEKVRINPGNYADKKKFEQLEYTDQAYSDELKRIEDAFSPLVETCKKNNTAMRIGTNHGSLSDRIMSRYGDTPLGMVESALEFIRICERMDYQELVISMKSSNPKVMVHAYRLLVSKLDEEGLAPYPLHLGVTEAGEAEDGRIKSAVGIGALLEDGLGDTIRVSLTEAPEAELPVARIMADRAMHKKRLKEVKAIESYPIHPYRYSRRKAREVSNFGMDNVPRVIADFSRVRHTEIKDLKSIGHFYLSELDKWAMNDLGADFIYTADRPLGFMLPNGLKEVVNYAHWLELEDRANKYPYIQDLKRTSVFSESLNFIEWNADEYTKEVFDFLATHAHVVLVLYSEDTRDVLSMRRFMCELLNRDLHVPVVFKRSYQEMRRDELMVHASIEIGTLLIDGLGDGVMLSPTFSPLEETLRVYNDTAFGILQAAKTRTTKAEYISCPSCGRTLFDLEETTAMIRKRTDHLKGVKIGIMGCIVNGPGEMADADFGYVGSGKGKITLYKGREVVKKGVPSEFALEELIALIKENGRWIEPSQTDI